MKKAVSIERNAGFFFDRTRVDMEDQLFSTHTLFPMPALLVVSGFVRNYSSHSMFHRPDRT